MMRTRIFFLAILSVSLVALNACTREEAPVHLGYVEAEWAYVAAPSAGRIVQQDVKQGDRVEAGAIVFRLDATAEESALAEASARASQAAAEAENLATGARAPEVRQLRANLREAQARLAQATKERDRIFPLIEQGFQSPSRADALDAELEVAQAAVEAAKQRIAVANLPGRPASQTAAEAATLSAEAAMNVAAYRLSERSIMAPRSGRIEEVFYRTGEYVMPGTPVMSILPEDGLKVRFFVPEANLSKLVVGKSVKVRADGLANPVEGLISFISHEAEFTPPVIYSRNVRDKLVFLVEADLPVNEGYHPGMPVEVDW